MSATELENREYELRRVVEKRGHSLYRIFLQAGLTIVNEPFLVRWVGIQALGATYENGNGKLVSVIVPPSSDAGRISNPWK